MAFYFISQELLQYKHESWSRIGDKICIDSFMYHKIWSHLRFILRYVWISRQPKCIELLVLVFDVYFKKKLLGIKREVKVVLKW